ncbi:hypothetical protein FMEXI_1655 [Fusarium mexicanum]|uniref:Uncharacterized protein n=1 Tax=Fusarium mexicanum TaxID=751941 RepID=A0A8H5JGX0_9HYPO|nr:hypothetical protein FMEXI_1655 [Fusarium mexicanum]
MDPADQKSPSSSSSSSSSFSSSVPYVHSPSSPKSTATSSRKVSPPELKLEGYEHIVQLKQCENKQPPAPESPAQPGASRLPEALADFKRKADAGEAGAWTVLPLSNEDHTNYLEQIEAVFRRFDYDPTRGCIAIRMPGLVHESFICEFNLHLRTRLISLGLEHQNTVTGDFINKIRGYGSADMGLKPNLSKMPKQDMENAKKFTRSPDAQFALKDAGLSGVVVEVAYSQDGKKLRGLARDYIIRSRGKVKAVIGFDLNRGEKTPADGELTLHLHDFAEDKRCQGVHNLCISIPYSELSTILGSAERRAALIKSDLLDEDEDEEESFDLSPTSSKSEEDLYPEEDVHPEEDPKDVDYDPDKSDSGSEETSLTSHVKKRPAARADLAEGQGPKRLATLPTVDEPTPTNEE